MRHLLKQDGWKSRKLWLTVATMGMIFWGFRLCGSPKDLFGQYCMALLTAAGFFKAASVYEKIKGAEPTPPKETT